MQLWVAQQLMPSVSMSVAACLELVGPLDVGLLEHCGRVAASELESPLLRFGVHDGEPCQWVCGPSVEAFDYVESSVEAATVWMEDDCHRPIDLSSAGLSRTRLFRVGRQRYLWYLRSHHIVLDGLGAVSMLRRIGKLYASGGAAASPCGALSMRRMVAIDAEYRASARYSADRAYWHERMRGWEPENGLVDRSASPSPRPLRFATQLDPQAATRLNSSLRRSGSGFAELVVTAFAGYTASMVGRDDLTLSLPVAARPTAALRRSAGSAANVVPLRLSGFASGIVSDAVARVRGGVVGALRHQLYRAVDIQRDCCVDARRGGFGPVVNVLGRVGAIGFGSISATAQLLSVGPVEDLVVNAFRLGADDGGVLVEFRANPALYTAEALAAHHRGFLDYLAAFPSLDADMPLPAAGAAPVMPALVTAPPRLLPDLLTENARRRPDVAVVDGTRVLSYGELDTVSSQWARELIGRGVGPGDVVAVAVSRSAESVAATWAVAKCGACLMPLDPTDPSPRLARVLVDSGARIGLALPDTTAGLPTTIRWLAIDLRRPSPYRSTPVGDAERVRPLCAWHPAYLIYTSGTTGAPKGVVVAHHGLGPLRDTAVTALRVQRDSAVLHSHAPTFDAHLLELLAAFGAGARLVIQPLSVIAGDALAAVIREHDVTHLLTTPTMLATLSPEQVPSLRTVAVGGEPCPQRLVGRWAEETAMFNGYGPTETTVIACLTERMAAGEPVTVGRPLPAVQTIALDSRLRPAPAGARAQLYVAGCGVALGYHGRPGATAARFVADPFAPGRRMYRTGDMVRIRHDRVIEFLGRADAQLALRGRRVEPAEIEAALIAQPEIDRAAVAVTTSPELGDRLIGYVVVAGGQVLDSAAVSARLHDVLPAALVPAALVQMSALPVTAGGKVDRRALPRHAITPRAYRDLENPTQRLVAALMAEAVQQPRVGLDDDFFELGGTSLLGVTLAAKLAEETKAPVTVRWIYAAPTVSSLAARITAIQTSDDVVGAETLAADNAMGTVLPLRHGGNRTPLFCIHSAVPLAWCYAGLSQYLPDRPVYGLQAPGADALGSLADLAACYATEVARVRSSGPYLLLGWSLGGQIAHAVAVELRRRGLPVALVVMLDSVVVPDGIPEPPSPRMRDLLTHLLGDEPEDADTLPEVTAESAAEWLSNTASLGTGLTAEQLRSLHAGYVQGVRLAHGYRPARFDGDLLYFSAIQGITAGLDSGLWRPHVAGEITEHPVDAVHAQLTNTDVLAVIGPRLAAYLDGRGL